MRGSDSCLVPSAADCMTGPTFVTMLELMFSSKYPGTVVFIDSTGARQPNAGLSTFHVLSVLSPILDGFSLQYAILKAIRAVCGPSAMDVSKHFMLSVFRSVRKVL